MALLNVDNLSVYFHTREELIKAVDGISFTLDKGRVLGIVGESGSGKSVACYSLLGLLPTPPARVESGTAVFNGRDLLQTDAATLRRIRGHRIGMIFQDPMTSLNPYLTIGDQLAEPLRLHQKFTRKQSRARAVEALQEVGIPNPEKRIDDFPHQFSGGMRQRVMIAMALITEPELLIADEPTTALDVTVQAQILDLIRRLQAGYNLSVIFVTHDLGVVAGLADRIAVMHEGRIVEQGDTDTIFYHTAHAYTRKLLGSIPTEAKPHPSLARENDLLTADSIRVEFPVKTGRLFGPREPGFRAVDNVSLNIREGEILGLVGESGSGKSTFARSIVQLIDIGYGSLKLGGDELSRLSGRQLLPYRRRMQMIFQDPYASLNPRMTVFDSLAEPMLIHQLQTRAGVGDAVNRLMDEVGLARRYIRKYPHEFSGGQRQRVAIARALALQPRLLIADEPVSALDVTIQAQILDLLLQLNCERLLSMLFISHDLSVVRYVCDRVAVMYQGKIVESADTETVFQSPRHDYTRALLSAVPLADPQRERQRKRISYSPG